MKINQKVAQAFRPLYESMKRYIVYYGGRGAGKTWHVADRLVTGILQEKEPDFVYACLRETQQSLLDSTKSTIWKSISSFGLEHLFYTARTSSEILCLANGCKFIFRGCGTQKEADKIRSIENVKMAWIEEAHSVKREVWEIFTPSVRAPNSKIILTFNPMRKSDFIYDHFVVQGDELADVVKVNYYDNPFFYDNEALVQEVNACRKFPHTFRRVWLGEPGFIENQLIKPEWWKFYDNLEEALKICTGMFITADTAYKTGTLHDYTVIQLWGYNSGAQLLLLKQIRGKWEFPTLVSRIRDFAKSAHTLSKHVYPSAIYIEDKASGISLVQTLAREGLHVVAWKPKDYHFPEDKVGRANEAALMISRGVVWLPSPANEPWVNDFITECSEFSEEDEGHDDQVDATTMGVSVFRSMGGGTMQLRNQ